MANSYPTWWDTTLTIYNKYKDPITDMITWYKHIVSNCFWKYTGEKVSINDNIIETNDIICRIPKSEFFMENYLWKDLPDLDKPDFFTINRGDIIVKGAIADDIDEYTKGSHSSDFIQKYKDLQGCLVVKSSTINVGGGRYNEHYFIKGE